MNPSDLVIMVERRLTLPQWQEAIDGQDFLARLQLDPAQEEAELLRRARLAGEEVTFAVQEVELDAVWPNRVGLSRPLRPPLLQYAFATPAKGDLKSCAAGGMALLAYAAGGQGGVFSSNGMLVPPDRAVRQHFDALAAAGFGREADYAARYPAPDSGSGGMSISVTRAR